MIWQTYLKPNRIMVPAIHLHLIARAMLSSPSLPSSCFPSFPYAALYHLNTEPYCRLYGNRLSPAFA